MNTSGSLPKVLLIGVEPLFPIDSGGRVRVAEIANVLRGRFELHYLFVGESGGEIPAEVSEIHMHEVRRERPRKVLAGRLSLRPKIGHDFFPVLHESLLRLLREDKFDFVFWTHSYLAALGLDVVKETDRKIINIVDFANLEVKRLGTELLSARNPLKIASTFLEFLKCLFWEPAVARKSEKVISLSRDELSLINRFTKGSCLFCPNGVQVVRPSFLKSGRKELRVLTVANWTYSPNSDGLRDFLRGDWPKIQEEFPDIELRVCGKGSENLVREHTNGVAFLGFVPDLSVEYELSDYVLAPAKYGAGSQLKIAEAIGRGKLVIGPKYLKKELQNFPGCSIFPSQNYVRTIKETLPKIGLLEEANFNYATNASWSKCLDPLLTFMTEI